VEVVLPSVVQWMPSEPLDAFPPHVSQMSVPSVFAALRGLSPLAKSVRAVDVSTAPERSTRPHGSRYGGRERRQQFAGADVGVIAGEEEIAFVGGARELALGARRTGRDQAMVRPVRRGRQGDRPHEHAVGRVFVQEDGLTDPAGERRGAVADAIDDDVVGGEGSRVTGTRHHRPREEGDHHHGRGARTHSAEGGHIPRNVAVQFEGSARPGRGARRFGLP
jgi:hypothetical protein